MDPRFKCKIIKFLEDDKGKNLWDLELGEDLVDMSP